MTGNSCSKTRTCARRRRKRKKERKKKDEQQLQQGLYVHQRKKNKKKKRKKKEDGQQLQQDLYVHQKKKKKEKRQATVAARPVCAEEGKVEKERKMKKDQQQLQQDLYMCQKKKKKERKQKDEQPAAAAAARDGATWAVQSSPGRPLPYSMVWVISSSDVAVALCSPPNIHRSPTLVSPGSSSHSLSDLLYVPETAHKHTVVWAYLASKLYNI